MATITSNRRGIPPQILQPQNGAPAVLLSPEATVKFELGLTLIINAWQALTIAVQNSWGGPDSKDKRDWMCGAVAELFAGTPETDTDDLEDFLLQIMLDEFELAVEDESGHQVSDAIVRLRAECAVGNYSSVEQMHAMFLSKGGRESAIAVQRAGGEDDDDDDEDDSDDDDDEDEEMGDVEMQDEAVPELVRTRPERVVDDDGFELVQKGRRKR